MRSGTVGNILESKNNFIHAELLAYLVLVEFGIKIIKLGLDRLDRPKKLWKRRPA